MTLTVVVDRGEMMNRKEIEMPRDYQNYLLSTSYLLSINIHQHNVVNPGAQFEDGRPHVDATAGCRLSGAEM